MRIVALSEHYKEARGGTSCYVRHLCRELAAAGHEVFLISEPDAGESFPTTAWTPTDGYRRRNLIPDSGFHASTRLGRMRLARSVREPIRRIVDDLRPDVVHLQSGMLIAGVLSAFPRTPVRLWTINNIPPREYPFPHFESLPFLHEAMRKAWFSLIRRRHVRGIKRAASDRIIYISAATRDEAAAAGIPTENSVVIPMGIDPGEFFPAPPEARPPGDFPLILSVAGVIAHKGQMDVVEAMPAIRAALPGARYVNVGPVRDASYFRRVQDRTRALGLEACVRFRGYVPRADLLRAYRACDVYVQPSREEGFCIALLQAIACGKPVVGTRAGAMPEMIEGAAAGLILGGGDPAALAAAVVRLVRTPPAGRPEDRHAFVAANFSWSATARKTIALYGDILASAADKARP
jgi:glycosyltransferase involved in cell wall biosynthesis